MPSVARDRSVHPPHTTWVLQTSSTLIANQLLLERSTNLQHLANDPMRVLVGNAFWLSSPLQFFFAAAGAADRSLACRTPDRQRPDDRGARSRPRLRAAARRRRALAGSERRPGPGQRRRHARCGAELRALRRRLSAATASSRSSPRRRSASSGISSRSGSGSPALRWHGAHPHGWIQSARRSRRARRAITVTASRSTSLESNPAEAG
jgi:hypothetical protein